MHIQFLDAGLIQKCNFLHDGGYVLMVCVSIGGAWGRMHRETALATLADCMEGDEEIIMYGGTD